jgi:hypothetical protein
MENFESIEDGKFQQLKSSDLSMIRGGEFTRYIEVCWIGNNMDYDSVEDWDDEL